MTLIVGVSLDGAGDHPAAWRLPSAPDLTAFDGQPQRAAALRADAAGLTFATLSDSLALQSDRDDRVRGRLDALAVAAWLGPQTEALGLLPTVTVTHTEPFHVSTATATLDLVSRGRGGVLVAVSTSTAEAANVGRRGATTATAAWEQAGDVIAAVTGLWDSWDDDAEIRDVATSRFIDRNRLHRVDAHVRGADPGPGGELVGAFTIRGPSIVPRPPQGHPVVAVRVPVDGSAQLRTAAQHADLVLVDGGDPAATAQRLRDAVAAHGRSPSDVRVVAGLRVVLDVTQDGARRRLAELDALDSDSVPAFAGTPAGLVDLVAQLAGAGLDGVELRPAVLTDDLERIADDVVPLLQERGLLAPSAGTFRDRLGLPRPESIFRAVP